MKKTAAAIGAAFALFLVGAGSAYATHCSVVNKPISSGEAGTATVNVVTGVFTITSLNLTPSGRVAGSFLTVTVIGPGGIVLDVVSVFGRKDLPEGAHLSGPGGSPCDGVGIDDLAECGT